MVSDGAKMAVTGVTAVTPKQFSARTVSLFRQTF